MTNSSILYLSLRRLWRRCRYLSELEFVYPNASDQITWKHTTTISSTTKTSIVLRHSYHCSGPTDEGALLLAQSAGLSFAISQIGLSILFPKRAWRTTSKIHFESAVNEERVNIFNLRRYYNSFLEPKGDSSEPFLLWLPLTNDDHGQAWPMQHIHQV